MNRWLRCHGVGNGVFSDERTVTVCERGNGPIDFIVSKEHCRDDDEPAVKVEVYFQDGGMWALIPTAQPEPIPIEDKELLPA